MLPPAGLPHSDIQGSTEACSSPWLFAACHVLPRLPAPRHPPCALTALGQFLLATPKNRPTSRTAYQRSSLPQPVLSISSAAPMAPHVRRRRPRSHCGAAEAERIEIGMFEWTTCEPLSVSLARPYSLAPERR